MSVLLTVLGDLTGETSFQIVVTVAAVGLLLAVLLSYRRLQGWVCERTKPLYGDIVTSVLLIGICAVALGVVLEVWGWTETLYAKSNEIGLDRGAFANAAITFILVIGTLIFTRFIRRVINEVLGSATAVTDHQREITHRISQVIIWALSVVIVLSVWIDDLGGLLVGAGFFGIVVGMAARQTLGTVLAGFVLMFDRPFEIGDWIEVDDEEGIVTDISIVNTRLQSFDGEYIMIPNDVISSSMVTNRSRRGRLRVEVDVGVDYESDVERAAEIAKTEVEDLDESLTAPSPQVITKEFADSAIVLGVRFWIDKPSARRFLNARTAAIHAIKRAFEDEEIKIPYPQRELSGRAETGGFRVAENGSRATQTATDAPTSDRNPRPELPSEDD